MAFSIPTPSKSTPNESQDEYKKRMEETDDPRLYHIYLPYTLYEERNLPPSSNHSRPPQFNMTYLLN